jgi:hypothetical protein
MFTSRIEQDDHVSGSHLQERIGVDTTKKNIMCSVEVETLLDFRVRSQQNMSPCNPENESV